MTRTVTEQAILSSRRAQTKSSDKRRSKVSINLRQRAKKAVRRENSKPVEETGTNSQRLLKNGQGDDQNQKTGSDTATISKVKYNK